MKKGYKCILAIVNNGFSEEAMDALFREKEYPPLFDAYLSVKKYMGEKLA